MKYYLNNKKMANKVLFYRGLYENYNADSMVGAIYFATDTGEILIDGKKYGNSQEVVRDVTLSDGNLIITYNSYTNGVPNIMTIPTSEIMLNFSEATTESAGLMSASDKIVLENLKDKIETFYVPSDSLLTVTSAEHGALSARTGQSFKDAKLSFSEMFDAILFPTINPIITNPSATISVSSSDKNVEVGTIIPTYTVTYDDGKVTLDGIIQYDSYGGNKTGEIITITDGLIAGESYMPAKQITYSAVVSYDKGTNQPMTNKNEAYGSTCESGSVSATVTVYPYYTYYATTNTSSKIPVAQSILRNAGISSVTTPELTLNAHTINEPQIIKLPVRTMSNLQMYNTVSGKYENISFTN
jgi:hypothetical protein